MNLPGQPPTFRQPTETELPWAWRFADGEGAAVAVRDDLAAERFATRSDAESWMGEVWGDLAADGAVTATLVELDRVVYGPMPLED